MTAALTRRCRLPHTGVFTYYRSVGTYARDQTLNCPCCRHRRVASLAAAVRATAPADASSVGARIEAGCTLWDISVTEKHASAMCSAGLVPVACTVLRHCTEAEELLTRAGVTDSSYRLAERRKGGLGEEGGGRRGAAGVAGGVMDTCNGMSLQEATRLREITCGLLANACSHRTLRQVTCLCG